MRRPLKHDDPKEVILARCREWQRRLRLGDWFIKFEVRDRIPGKWGENALQPELKRARIALSRENGKSMPSPLDQTIIHELLHCHVGRLELHARKDHFPEADEEPLVDGLAWAIFETAFPKAKGWWN